MTTNERELDDAPPVLEREEANLQALGKFLVDDRGGFLTPPDAEERKTGVAEEHTIRKLPGDSLLKGESVQQRVLKVNASRNPLLEASQPLLRALSDMPAEVPDAAHVELLKSTLRNEINLFSIVCDEAGIPWKKMAIVRYSLCTALDEAAHATPWGLETGWSQSNLLNHFEGDNDGGNKFFLLIGRLSMSAHEYADVLEVLLRILGLGFEGRYSIIEDGDRQLMKIRQRLLTLLQSTRDTTPSALSPHALVTRVARKRHGWMIPVRVTALICALLLGAAFIWCKYRLSIAGNLLQERIYALHHMNVSLPAAKPRLRLSILLKEEIARHLVTVDETRKESKVIFPGDAMFEVGSAKVRPEMEAILQRVAQEIHRVQGKVVIVGHTDSTPIHRPEFKDNLALSRSRAAEVAVPLLDAGIPQGDINIQGVGDSQPVSSNKDEKGRALNRRVEIFVTY